MSWQCARHASSSIAFNLFRAKTGNYGIHEHWTLFCLPKTCIHGYCFSLFIPYFASQTRSRKAPHSENTQIMIMKGNAK